MAKRDEAGRRPKLVVALGRGKTGKTTVLTYLAEAPCSAYPLRIIDADTANQSLSARFQRAERPGPGVTEVDRGMWVEAQIEAMMEAAASGQPYDALLDVGGNDGLLKRLGREVELANVLQEAGIDPVAIHMIGPDGDDLSYLRAVEARGLFCPPATIVVANGGLVPPGRSNEAAFSVVLADPVIKNVEARGGRFVFMPALPCMREIEAAGKTPRQALECWREIKLGMLNKVRVQNWLERDMPEMRAQVADWLP